MTTEDYAAALARYQKIVAEFPDLEVKGKANRYTSMNGNMFSFLDKTGTLCLRLSDADRAAFVEIYGTGPVKQYGAIMKEYVEVPEEIFADPDRIHIYFEKCLSYAASLPVKATKRR